MLPSIMLRCQPLPDKDRKSIINGVNLSVVLIKDMITSSICSQWEGVSYDSDAMVSYKIELIY